MKVRIYCTNVTSRAIYTPKIVFACIWYTRFSRAYDTHFMAYNAHELPSPLNLPKGFSEHIWHKNATRNGFSSPECEVSCSLFVKPERASPLFMMHF